jgi:hypothetical protein
MLLNIYEDRPLKVLRVDRLNKKVWVKRAEPDSEMFSMGMYSLIGLEVVLPIKNYPKGKL